MPNDFDAKTHREGTRQEIAWRSWSEEPFDEARRSGRIVLLDLTASWCHWCHVMDQTTYEDDSVVRLIEENFIPVRVDIDKRPDISDRYNRGGFPTTVFLSDRGESIWGTTYIPPGDMKRIIGSILEAQRSGEISRALTMSREEYDESSSAGRSESPLGILDLEDIFEDIFSTYDVEDGGFGVEPKFPHPDVVDILLFRHREREDPGIAHAAITTLKRMTEGLYDKVEGGIFRYSVTRDWKTPHFEKMLETNTGFLRNAVHAYAITGDEEFERSARGTVEYMLSTLRDRQTGGFYGSQDADEEYYHLDMAARMRHGQPSVDKTMYAGWNSEAVATLLDSGMILDKKEWMDAALKAWRNIVTRLWDDDKKLVRHVESDRLYLFEDQVSFFNALIAVFHATGDRSVLGMAEGLVAEVERSFGRTDGGYNDVVVVEGAVGELVTPRRNLVANSNWAFALAAFGAMTGNDSYTRKGEDVLSSFTRADVESHGVFGAPYLRARWFLERGPIVVDVRASPEKMHDPTELCACALSVHHPAVVLRRTTDSDASRPYAVVCAKGRCFPRTESSHRLRGIIEAALANLE